MCVRPGPGGGFGMRVCESMCDSECYNISGSFMTDYHIDFTGSTTGIADSSSGSAQLIIIWRTRRHQAEDNATIR